MIWYDLKSSRSWVLNDGDVQLKRNGRPLEDEHFIWNGENTSNIFMKYDSNPTVWTEALLKLIETNDVLLGHQHSSNNDYHWGINASIAHKNLN